MVATNSPLCRHKKRPRIRNCEVAVDALQNALQQWFHANKSGIAVGGMALGGIAVGGMALGGMAVGGIAVGGMAVGGMAVGGFFFFCNKVPF